MTPAQSREELAKLPAEHRERVALMLTGAWQDGFAVGAARLPRKCPFDTVRPPAGEKTAKGKPK